MNRTPLDRLALVLMIIGALNWLLVGVADYDLVTGIFGGNLFAGRMSVFSRIIFALVGIAGLSIRSRCCSGKAPPLKGNSSDTFIYRNKSTARYKS